MAISFRKEGYSFSRARSPVAPKTTMESGFSIGSSVASAPAATLAATSVVMRSTSAAMMAAIVAAWDGQKENPGAAQ